MCEVNLPEGSQSTVAGILCFMFVPLSAQHISQQAASSLLCRVNSVLARGWSGWLWHLPVGVLAAQLLLYGLSEQGCPRPFQGRPAGA